ncbi:4879_t:CDS:2 [Ambispora gerdemannii]|uniref:4879_t:CDS:1 n=1 Tax=Ambispora gerdemannii TaxID=144530 RepID=A0A9N8ZEZ8_9GLOM|nr:4879_t:CDS:2 [Ambispora gerdemannii]
MRIVVRIITPSRDSSLHPRIDASDAPADPQLLKIYNSLGRYQRNLYATLDNHGKLTFLQGVDAEKKTNMFALLFRLSLRLHIIDISSGIA